MLGNMDTREDLGALVEAISATNGQLVEASRAGDVVRIEALVRDVKALERRRNRLLADGAAELGVGGYEASIPVRDQVIQALHLAGHPATHRLLADIARARTGESIPTAALASLRRDEARSWTNAQDINRRTATRDVYVVPALSHDRLAPVRGTLALSTWPTSRRLIAPLSPRVDFLRIAINLAEEVPAVAGTRYEPSMRRLVARLGSTIPGVAPFGSEPEQVARAAGVELEQLEQLDEEERDTAAARATAQLGQQALLFGTALRVLKARPVHGAVR